MDNYVSMWITHTFVPLIIHVLFFSFLTTGDKISLKFYLWKTSLLGPLFAIIFAVPSFLGIFCVTHIQFYLTYLSMGEARDRINH